MDREELELRLRGCLFEDGINEILAEFDRLTKENKGLEKVSICPECKTEPMVWYAPWDRYICSSWWHMEGGCKTWDDDEPIHCKEEE